MHSRDRLVPREQWEVLIPDHHRGFITWAAFEANTARLRGNWRRPRELAGGAVREGRALLQGLLRCGRCGRIMQTAYSGTKGNCPRYVCARAKQLYAGEHVCQRCVVSWPLVSMFGRLVVGELSGRHSSNAATSPTTGLRATPSRGFSV